MSSRPSYSRIRSRAEPATTERIDDHRGPWATALNSVIDTNDVELTILSVVLVDRLIRLSATLRMPLHPDVRLRGAPALTLRPAVGTPLSWLRAHVLPDPPLFWLSWTFERPDGPLGDIDGCIDRIELANRTGSRSEVVTGPWRFQVRGLVDPAPFH